MKIADYRNFLVKLKEQFHSCLHSRRKSSLSVQEVSQLIYRHIKEEPFMIKDLLLKGTGKLSVTWDELLQYMQQEIQIREQVQKIQHCPPSATEIIQSHQAQFAKLVQYVKQKETNMIQSLRRLPVEVGGSNLFLVCMDKEIAVFDFENKEMLNSIEFRFSKMKQKIFEREENRRILKEKLIQKQTEEFLDKVVVNYLDVEDEERKKSGFGRMLTSNIKSSIRGSVLSSDHSDKPLFRRQTQSGQTKRKQRQNFIRIKNDDVSRVFTIFENATLNNSINVARAFTAARSNFEKHIVLDKSVLLEKEKPEKSYGMMSQVYHHNYKKELQEMRNTNVDLSNIRKSLIQKGKGCRPARKLSENVIGGEASLSKLRRTSNAEPAKKDKDILQIADMSILSNYLLVSLFNREIRLLHMKKGLNSIKVQIIFEKQFKSVVTFLQLFHPKPNEYHILVVLEHSNKNHTSQMQKSLLPVEDSGLSEVQLYQLDQSMNISNKLFQNQVDFSAKYQSALPYGIILFNEKGHFCLMELSSSEGNHVYQTTLSNPQTGHKVSTNEVRVHRNLLTFFLCCSNGYVYLFDRLSKKIKYYTKASPSPVIDISLIKQDSQLITLYQNGNMAILSTLHLEQIFLYQSYHEVSLDSKILTVDPTNFVVYNCRSFKAYCLCSNEEREFDNVKPMKILKNRNKLRRPSMPSSKEKSKVYKVIDGKGGVGNFVCILFQQGEICFLDPELKYLGSYYCLKVTSIIDITCNQNYQFICILYDDNTLEVINLYTQSILFPVVLQEHHHQTRPRKESITSISKEKKKHSKKIKENIVLMNFFSQTVPNLFLGLITQTNNVYHLSEKGTIVSIVNLQQSCKDALQYTHLLFEQESLVLLTGQSVTVLYRHSYTKKCVIYVSHHELLTIRRALIKGCSQLLCLDALCNVFIVNTKLKSAELLCSLSERLRDERCLFNWYMIMRQGQSHSKVNLINENKSTLIRTDSRVYYYSLMGKNILQISKQTGKLWKFNLQSQVFQQFFY